MRILMLAGAVILLNGCNKGPILAGGKPVAHWVQALNDPDAKVRKAAAIKLGNVGPADATAFPALHNALHDGDADVRCEMILALVKFGRKAKEASASLDELRLHDPDAKVRDYAAKALAKFDQFP